jgi:hypothetical protein
MDASKALSILKGNVTKASFVFQKELEDRFSTINVNEEGFYMYVEEETVKISGEVKTIRRVFVQSSASDYGGVGWVINEDITACMICHGAFGMFRWAHHCRSCGNLVCSVCSPDNVVIEELSELGPVRICIMCYWGQDPVHTTFQRQNKQLEGNVSFTNRQQSMAFVPVFAVECGRITPDNRQRKIVIHVCLHDVMVNWPDDRDFVVCEDFFETREFENGNESIVEMYHVVVRADILDSTDINLDSIKTKQIADSVLAAVAEQFEQRLFRPILLHDDRSYAGVSNRVHLPFHRLDRIPKLKLSKSTTLSKPYFVETIAPLAPEPEKYSEVKFQTEPNSKQFRSMYPELKQVPTAASTTDAKDSPSSADIVPQLREFETVVLRSSDESEQKALMRDMLLQIIREYQPDHAQRVIDELLKLDIVKLLQLLHHKQALKILVYDTLVDLVKVSNHPHSGDITPPHGDQHTEQTRKLKKVNSMLARRSASIDDNDSFMQDVALAAERLKDIKQNQIGQLNLTPEKSSEQGQEQQSPSYLEEKQTNIEVATPQDAKSSSIHRQSTRVTALVPPQQLDVGDELDFGNIYGAEETSSREERYSVQDIVGVAPPVSNDDMDHSYHGSDEDVVDFSYEHAFEEKKHRTSILLQDDFYQQQTRDSLQAFRAEKERESLSMAGTLTQIPNLDTSDINNNISNDMSFSDIYGTSSQQEENEERMSYSHSASIVVASNPPFNNYSAKSNAGDRRDSSSTIVGKDYNIFVAKDTSSFSNLNKEPVPEDATVSAMVPAVVAVQSEKKRFEITAEAAANEEKLFSTAASKPISSPVINSAIKEDSHQEFSMTEEIFFNDDLGDFRSIFGAVVGKDVKIESEVIVAEQNKWLERYAFFLQRYNDNVFLPALVVHPVPWIVIKSKDQLIENGDKVFVNLCHSVSLPLLSNLPAEIANNSVFFQNYLQKHYVIFTLNKVRHVMHIQVPAVVLEQQQARAIDVTVHSNIFLIVNQDAELADKLFVKVLKAAGRAHGCDLDVDYKLPRTLKNYKGAADSLPVMRIPRETVSSLGYSLSLSNDASVSRTSVSRASTTTTTTTTITTGSTFVKPSSLSAAKSVPPVSTSKPPTPQSTTSRTLPTPSTTVLTAAESQSQTAKWKRVLKSPNAKVLFSSCIIKRNKLGIGVKRQLILTNEPALFYVDATTMTIKGDIDWPRNNPPRAIKISNDVFDIVTDGRTYRMEDQDRTADKWVQAINQLARS